MSAKSSTKTVVWAEGGLGGGIIVDENSGLAPWRHKIVEQTTRQKQWFEKKVRKIIELYSKKTSAA